MDAFKVGDRVMDISTREPGRVIKVYVKLMEETVERKKPVYTIQWDVDGSTSEVDAGIRREGR